MEIEWDFKELENFADRLVDNRIETTLKKITKDISQILLRRIKEHTPVLDGFLLDAWGKNKLLVTGTKNGYEVLLINTTPYAVYVNDGHRQTPGRFVPGQWVGNRFVYDPASNEGMVLKQSWVEGRFFVEKGILSLSNSTEIEGIVMQELQKWWEGCF